MKKISKINKITKAAGVSATQQSSVGDAIRRYQKGHSFTNPLTGKKGMYREIMDLAKNPDGTKSGVTVGMLQDMNKEVKNHAYLNYKKSGNVRDLDTMTAGDLKRMNQAELRSQDRGALRQQQVAANKPAPQQTAIDNMSPSEKYNRELQRSRDEGVVTPHQRGRLERMKQDAIKDAQSKPAPVIESKKASGGGGGSTTGGSTTGGGGSSAPSGNPFSADRIKAEMSSGKHTFTDGSMKEMGSVLGKWGKSNYSLSASLEGRTAMGAAINDAVKGAIGGAVIGGAVEAGQGGSFWSGAKEGAFNGAVGWSAAKGMQRATGADSMLFGKNNIYNSAKGMIAGASGDAANVAKSAQTLLSQRQFQGLSNAVVKGTKSGV